MADRGRQRLGARADQLEMLGRQRIDQGRRLLDPADQEHGAVLAPARAGDRRPRSSAASCALDRRHHASREAAVVGDQDRLRALVVLGLRQQIGRDPVRVDHGLGDDHDLRGPAIMSIPTRPNTWRFASAT